MRRQACSARWQAHLALLTLSTMLLAGCSSLDLLKPRWPFSSRSAPAPEVVDELTFESVGEVPVSAFPQFFRRNTLIVDMTAAGAAGAVTLRPHTRFGWPVRVAFRVRPGAFAALELVGDQRLVLPVVADGHRATLDLELPPGFVPARDDRAIEVRWGAVAGAQSVPIG
jgi:hypothetical protein